MNRVSPVISIGGHEIAQHRRAFLIGEVAQAHDGSLGFAHAFIDVAASAKFDAVKFQTHVADAESTLDEQFRVNFSYEDATRYAYWQRMEFTAEQWGGLAEHARAKNLVFMSSCFSVRAVEMMRAIGMPAWKVGSGETQSESLIDAMAQGGEPILLSTGLANTGAVGRIVEKLSNRQIPVGIFQCTSRYPTRFEDIGLNVIDELNAAFGCPTGLSDHSGAIWPGVAAMARGAALIEVHMALHKLQFGPDTPASLVPDELARLVEARNAIATMLSQPVNKDRAAGASEPMRRMFGKSLALRAPLSAGTILEAGHLTYKKPGDGLSQGDLDRVLGRQLRRDVPSNRLLRFEDLSDV